MRAWLAVLNGPNVHDRRDKVDLTPFQIGTFGSAALAVLTLRQR
jgi:hypothetical protein